MLCYFHGGGFVFEDLDSYDPFCRVLANASGCLVASVGYRLAPEHPYPAGLIDCYTATAWLAANPGGVGARPGPVAIGGDSAGGNLAAAVALMARDRRGPDIAHQVLIYPFLDPACAEPSHARLPWPATEDMLWCWDQYLPAAAARDDPYAAPLSAGDHRGLPPAFVLTAEFDPLRDEGAAYAERLRVAGVPTRYECWPGQLHGFLMHAGALDDAAAARRRIGSALRRAMLP
ncbi:alpha/beta hydrolase [Dactylosporangium sucinum]